MRGLVGALILGLFVAFPVQAAVLLPSSADIVLEPGTTTVQTWQVINDSGTRAQYHVELQAVTFGQLADEVHFAPLSADEQAWFTITPGVFTLSSEESSQITLTVAVPPEAEKQVRTIAVLVIEENGESLGIGLQEAVASIVFITIGDANLRIDDFQVFQDRVWRGPVSFAAALTNTGGGLAQPQMHIVIRDILGRVVEVINMNDLGKRLPAQTTRSYTTDWSGPIFGFGPYSADLVVLPADDAELLGKSASMVLFTWQSGALLAALLPILGIGGWGLKRYLKR